jgi:hypothetical protein
MVNGLVKFGLEETKDEKDGRIKWRPIICVTSSSRDFEFLGTVLLDSREQAVAFVTVLEKILSTKANKSNLIL